MEKGVDKPPQLTWVRLCSTGRKVIISVSKIPNDSKKTRFAVGVQNLKACVITGGGGEDQISKTLLVRDLRKRPFKKRLFQH